MPSVESDYMAKTVSTARREMAICNACRYCEGFCAVFPAMMRKREFTDGDLNYFANLCHNCRACFYACQYAPPHPFGVNLPQALSQLRAESYEQYAWPRPLAALYRRSGTVLCIGTSVAIALLLGTLIVLNPLALTTAITGAGAFYRVVPWIVMTGAAGAAMVFALIVLTIGAIRFWRDAGAGAVAKGGELAQAVHAALTLRYLGGGHEGKDGCNDTGESFSQKRRRFHHLLFYGFSLCFASTTVGFIYDHFQHWVAPYPLMSAPVLLGATGGIGMAVGSVGLFWLKVVGDPAPVARKVLGGEYALLGLLFTASSSGLLLLAVRETAAMGAVLAIHLGVVLSLFLMLPYSKMVHGLYRGLALLRFAREAKTGG